MKKQIVSIKQGAQKGFTLIELMIVVAIIAILAAFALPAYQDYTVRTRVAEGLTLASSAKIAMTEFYATNRAWPSSNTQAGMANASKITGNAVKSVAVNSNVITVTYNDKVAGAGKTGTVTITAPTSPAPGESITWKCISPSSSIDNKYLPTECRS